MLLYVVGSVVLALFLGALGWVVVNSADVAAPDVSDLIPKTVRVPDKDNAYVYLASAGALHWPKDDPNPELRRRNGTDGFVADALARNVEALALLEQGLACPAYQPSVGSASSASQETQGWYRVAMLLAQKAAYERRTGQSALRCECLRPAAPGFLVTSHPRSLHEWFAGMMALELGLEAAEQWLHAAPRDEAELLGLSERLKAVGPFDAGPDGSSPEGVPADRRGDRRMYPANATRLACGPDMRFTRTGPEGQRRAILPRRDPEYPTTIRPTAIAGGHASASRRHPPFPARAGTE